MNADAGTSAVYTAKTSHNGLPREPKPDDDRARPHPAAYGLAPDEDKLPEDLSEADLLQREMETAKAAITQTLRELQADLAKAGDIRHWTKEYPWAAVGVAAAAGFVAATAVSSQGSHGVDYEDEPRRRRRAGRRSASGRQTNRMGWLWNPLYDLIKTAITTAVASSIHSAAEAPAGADGRAQPTAEAQHA